MILFFGTRPGKTEIKSLHGVKCPYCAQPDTLTLSQTSNWFHLFWIKIFRFSRHTIAECEHCKRVYFENEFTEEMQRNAQVD
ncbi:zinc-ribbon domain-containing protein [Maribacter sp. 2307UL18-2]|uniref:zinc-ribbon domain-containing protein n=1 Tax=Maribacter sp. 2307UL18-2 TaxID=3386274 RepID=UPI0039BD0FDE